MDDIPHDCNLDGLNGDNFLVQGFNYKLYKRTRITVILVKKKFQVSRPPRAQELQENWDYVQLRT